MRAFGIEAVSGYLDANSAKYEIVEHNVTYTAAAEARATKITADNFAKTVVLHADDGYRLAVIPASERLDMQKARRQFGEVRMASEEEMQSDIKSFELGAIPPFGSLIDAPETIDQRLVNRDQIHCSGGDHRHSLIINPRELVRLTKPHVADLCQD